MTDRPRIFISYSHDSPEHADRVLALANRLIKDGLPCVIDQYEPHPKEPWPRWMERQIEEADFVLVVCTETYLRRASGREKAGTGRGGIFESVLIIQELYDAGMWNEKFIAVLLDEAAAAYIPAPLRGYMYYRVDTDSGYEDLYRHLTGQPRVMKPVPGDVRELPTEPAASGEAPSSPSPGPSSSQPPADDSRARKLILLLPLVLALLCALGYLAWKIRWPSPDGGIYGFEVAPNPVRISLGEALPLSVGWRDEKRVFIPAKAESWQSEKPEIASISSQGEVRALRPGGTNVAVLARSPHGLGAAKGWIEVASPEREAATFVSIRKKLAILGINDVYRIEGANGGARGGLARVRELRLELEREGWDVLLLHGGDFLFPSLMSRLLQGEQMVDVMSLMDGKAGSFDPRMFVTFGHHEFDRKHMSDAELLRSRIDESEFTWLGSNVTFAKDSQGRALVAAPNLFKSAIVEIGGARIGLIGLTVPHDSPEYVSDFADPLETAENLTAALRRQGADVVVAVTHLQLQEDVEILRQLGSRGPDLIIGGHEHEAQAQLVGDRWVRKADAEAQSATIVYVGQAADGTWTFTPELRQLGGSSPSPNREVQDAVTKWTERYDALFCSKLRESPNCLNRVLGVTRTGLIGEEYSLRSVETSLGNYIADQMRDAFAAQGAQVAFINSGSLRLNQNLPPGSPVTRRDLEELFAYPTPLHLLRIDGRTLGEIVQHAVLAWPGTGAWLQVSGFAFRFNPTTRRTSDLTLLTPSGPRPIRLDEQILAVTSDYLVNPEFGDQDGYLMLGRQQVVNTPQDGTDLKQLIQQALKSAGAIAPRLEGRICNTLAPGPCLARPAS